MEYVVVDGPQWGIEFDEPLYSLKDWGSVSSYIDHGDDDETDAGVNDATSAPRNSSGDDSPVKGAVASRSVYVAEARASAEAARDQDDGSNDSSGSGSEGVGDALKVGGSEGAHAANSDEIGVARTSIRGDVNGLSRSSNSNHEDDAEQEHDRSDGEIDSIRHDLKGAEQDVNFDPKTNEHDCSDEDDLKGVNCIEGAEQDVNSDSKTNEHNRSAEDDLKGVNCAEGAKQDVNFDSKTNEHDREDDLKGVNCAEGAEQDANFGTKTNEHVRSAEDDLKGVNCAEGADVNFDVKTNEHDRSADEIDSIRDDLNGAKGAEGGRDVNLNSEHDRQSEPRICAQTGNDDIRERIVDSQNDEVIPDTEEAGEHNELDGFLTPKPLKVVPPARKRARTQQKEKKEKEKGKDKEEQAKKQKAKGKKEKAKVEKDEQECDTNQCEICKKVFKHSWHLKEHRIVHSNEKHFVCNFPGCDSKYKRKSDLNIHLANHSGRKRPR